MPAPTRTVQPRVLSARLIPAPHAALREALRLGKSDEASFGVISCDRDHALFVALDEATKASPVSVAYTRSLYGGIAGASGPLAGEAIGILTGEDDEIVREGVKAVVRHIETSTPYYVTEGTVAVPFFPHVVSSLGTYLSKESGLKAGEAMAYLVAPPVESIVAVDAALKVADVKIVRYFSPPTEANHGGAWLSGTLAECEAAASAFTQAIASVAEQPIDRLGSYPYGRWTPK